MEVERHEDPVAFAELVTEHLLADEARNTVVLGLVARLAEGDDVPARFLSCARDAGGAVRAVAVRTDAHFPVTIGAPGSTRALDALTDDLATMDPPAPILSGPEPWARRAAGRLACATGRTLAGTMGLRTFRLDRVVPARPVPGGIRAVTAADTELLVAWLDAFTAEATPDEHRPGAAREAVTRMLARPRRGVRLWEVDGTPVAMASAGARTPHSERISAVYTPPELRGRGYASALVAALSQERLDDGRAFLTLFTDAANPTSNRISTALGYRHVGDAASHRLG